ncbi:MAG: DUF4339 domain-containing protein [Proteobacteria bacterium]|nr:DUF4339 domain-containing protein [Pseudomonadota bacterium]
MWFVWDGRTRSGPLSEQELCRRVSAGQIALSVYVRPEDNSVYRPLVWMLPEWTSAVPRPKIEESFGLPSSPMNDATQVASVDALFSQSPAEPAFTPVAPIPEKRLPAPPPEPPPPAAAKEFPSPPPAAAAKEFPSPPPPAAPPPREDPNILVVQAAIRDGQRETREFEERGRGGEREQKPESGELEIGLSDRPEAKGVQSPALASEGSVNLFNKNSSTQVKFRRVNPTAPRRKNKNPVFKFGAAFSRRGRSAAGGSDSSSTLLTVIFAVVMIAVIGFAGYYFYEKSQPRNFTETSPEAKSERRELQRTGPARTRLENSDRAANVRRVKKNSEKGKALASKPAPTPPPVAVGSSTKIYSKASELSQYLKNRGAAGGGGFIVVGPITILEKPRKGCEPCFVSGRLNDGSAINLTSGVSDPWNAVKGKNVIYAKGFLLGSANLTLTVNKLGTTPP